LWRDRLCWCRSSETGKPLWYHAFCCSIRVNSKAVTRTINVKAANIFDEYVRGICLAPLRGSQVLEILDVEDSFLTKNRLGLRFANFANHVSL
jgi:hypothetical protein